MISVPLIWNNQLQRTLKAIRILQWCRNQSWVLGHHKNFLTFMSVIQSSLFTFSFQSLKQVTKCLPTPLYWIPIAIHIESQNTIRIAVFVQYKYTSNITKGSYSHKACGIICNCYQNRIKGSTCRLIASYYIKWSRNVSKR